MDKLQNTKTEVWNGHAIRFIYKDKEWWAVAKDVAEALDYKDTTNAIKQHCPRVAKHHLGVQTGTKADGSAAIQHVEVNIISEKDIYRLIMRSNKPEAELFQDWVYDIIKELRQATGLEGFEIFTMLDPEHQKGAMKRLNDGLRDPVKVDFIKANTVANKAVSTMFGHAKMVKKEQMPPDMLVKRQAVLDDTVNLMTANESFGLGLSISSIVYAKYLTPTGAAR